MTERSAYSQSFMSAALCERKWYFLLLNTRLYLMFQPLLHVTEKQNLYVGHVSYTHVSYTHVSYMHVS